MMPICFQVKRQKRVFSKGKKKKKKRLQFYFEKYLLFLTFATRGQVTTSLPLSLGEARFPTGKSRSVK